MIENMTAGNKSDIDLIRDPDCYANAAHTIYKPGSFVSAANPLDDVAYRAVYESCIDTDIKDKADYVKIELDDPDQSTTASNTNCVVYDSGGNITVDIKEEPLRIKPEITESTETVQCNIAAAITSNADHSFQNQFSIARTPFVHKPDNAQFTTTVYQCNICHKRCEKRSDFNMHMRAHTEDKPYACVLCPKRFNMNITLESYTSTHKGAKRYECDICHKRYTRKSDLAKHILQNTGNVRNNCDICHIRYTHASDLEGHKRRKHCGRQDGGILRKESTGKNSTTNISNIPFNLQGEFVKRKRVHRKLYDCEICHKQFSIKSDLLSHMSTHTGEKPFECHICHKRYAHRTGLARHNTLIHTKGPQNECGQGSNLEAHKRMQCVGLDSGSTSSPLVQQIEPTDMSCTDNLPDHLTRTVVHIKDEPEYITIESAAHDPHQGATANHNNCSVYKIDSSVHEGLEKVPLCVKAEPEDCDQSRSIQQSRDEPEYVKFKPTLDSNVSLQHRTIPLDTSKCKQCQLCHKQIPDQNNGNKHICNHTAEEQYECDICHKLFTSKINLTKHIRYHATEGRYTCNICHRRFPQNSHIVIHMRSHTGEKPYECNICHKRFTRKNNLKLHACKHTRKKPYGCDICHKKFSWESDFARHVRVHTGEKYECDICHRRFSQNSHLTMHVRLHTGDKPYECDICHKRFTQQGNFKIHMRIHTGDRPHKCDICYKRFTQKSKLARHIRTHTGKRPYECGVCHKRFSVHQNYLIHSRIHGTIPTT